MIRPRFRAAYRACAAVVLVGGLPIFVLGAGFAGGFGSALNSFRIGLANFNPLDWFFLLPLILLPIYWWLGRGRNALAPTPWSWKLIIGGACLFGLALVFGSYRDTPVAEFASACHRGAYKLDDGRIMAVSVSPVAALNARFSDGSRAMTWTGDHLSFRGTSCIGGRRSIDDFAIEAGTCPASTLMVDTHDAPPQSAHRVPITEQAADFPSAGIMFRARLFVPVSEDPAPLVIIPASRDGSSNLDWSYEQYLLSGLRAAVFVYDKPETWPYGASQIEDDEEALTHMIAAHARAREVAARRTGKIGFYGGRDALLAASKIKMDFVAADVTEADEALLRAVRTPMLLLTPGGDRDVPTAEILRIVQRLHRAGRPADVIVFPGADKHMMRYDDRASERCQSGEPKSYFTSLADWLANGRIKTAPDARTFAQ